MARRRRIYLQEEIDAMVSLTRDHPLEEVSRIMEERFHRKYSPSQISVQNRLAQGLPVNETPVAVANVPRITVPAPNVFSPPAVGKPIPPRTDPVYAPPWGNAEDPYWLSGIDQVALNALNFVNPAAFQPVTQGFENLPNMFLGAMNEVVNTIPGMMVDSYKNRMLNSINQKLNPPLNNRSPSEEEIKRRVKAELRKIDEEKKQNELIDEMKRKIRENQERNKAVDKPELPDQLRVLNGPNNMRTLDNTIIDNASATKDNSKQSHSDSDHSMTGNLKPEDITMPLQGLKQDKSDTEATKGTTASSGSKSALDFHLSAPPNVPGPAPSVTTVAIVDAQSNLKEPAKEHNQSPLTTPPQDNLPEQSGSKNGHDGSDLPAGSNLNGAVDPPGKVGLKDGGMGSNAPPNTPGALGLVDSNGTSSPNVFQAVLPGQSQHLDTGMIGSDGLNQKIREYDQISAPGQDPPGFPYGSGAAADPNNNDDWKLKTLIIVDGIAVGALIFEPYLRRWIYKTFQKAKQQSQPQTQLEKPPERPTLYSVQPNPGSCKTIF